MRIKKSHYKWVGIAVWCVFLGIVVTELVIAAFNIWGKDHGTLKPVADSQLTKIINQSNVASSAAQIQPSPTPTPTPRPLTFAEMNAKYGPCVSVPVVFYHHVQTEEAAKPKNQVGLSVFTDQFRAQMQYLKDKGYNPIAANDVARFFDEGVGIPKKSIILTFDDGYEDFYTDAYPILKEFGFKATVFVPTGLMENPDYLHWSQIADMAGSGLIYFGNHTWSHHNAATSKDVVSREISTADTQLKDHNLDVDKIFAYPYGTGSKIAEDFLTSLNYKLAFTTRPGNILCKQQRLSLPRFRIGNGSMARYGF
jgi:peptidoglycan/xylan/chitin deacetylase (PgdA/CDA1 family)